MNSIPDRKGGGRGFGFRPGYPLTCVTAVMLCALVALGTWQVERLHWKEDLIARAEEGIEGQPVPLPALADEDPNWRDLDFRRVSVSGRFIVGNAFGFQVSTRGELVGGDLVVPMLLDDGRVILVDLGWLAETDLPPASIVPFVPAGQVALDGVARFVGDIRPGYLTPSPDLIKRRWFDWHIPAMSDVTGLSLLPVIVDVDQRSALAVDGKPMGIANRPQPRSLSIDYPNNHLGYALTWYGLAVGLVVIYTMMGFKRGAS
ncbi:surfeit locus 1 family protein [Arboricoccus pini]|uniref:SURF1-like protein n=1 Tax=Arboricoccus pini TaxID=1963835 RepID=A0A212QZF5_9PROT|nr:SURF1 family protein [Arboricoccus pini]SNB65099.1 surfeit locus 1 family protein [Arboricoccus pini]